MLNARIARHFNEIALAIDLADPNADPKASGGLFPGRSSGERAFREILLWAPHWSAGGPKPDRPDKTTIGRRSLLNVQFSRNARPQTGQSMSSILCSAALTSLAQPNLCAAARPA